MWLLHRILFTISILLFAVETICAQKVVTSLNQYGGVSLHSAIYSAGPTDTITFKPGLSGTIDISETIYHNVIIKGPGADIINISGLLRIRQSVTVTIIGLTFTGFYNPLEIESSATLNLINCSITNSPRIGINNSGNLNLTGCTISNNSTVVPSGNAVYAGVLINSGRAALLNCTISGNSNSGIVAASFTEISIVNCTITKNSNSGIRNLSSTPINIQNTIVTQNTKPGGMSDVLGSFNSLGFNIIGVSDGTNGFIDGMKNDLVGTISNPRDPKLGPLQDNGGPTFTHALLLGSPAIDTDSDILAQMDQRGFTRPYHGKADIGAFEVSEHEMIVTNLNDSGFGSLRGAIQYIVDPFNYNGIPKITFRKGLSGIISLQSDLVIHFDIEIQGPGADIITVSGYSIIVGPNASMTGLNISGLTIANGGGISHNGKHNTVITNCTLMDNSRGAYCGADGTMKISGSTISGNSQEGVYAGGVTTIENSTISGNSGPGISNHAALLINSCTITDNKNSGVVNSGNFTASVHNSIIAKNTDPSGSPDVAGQFVSQGFNLIGVSDGTNNFTNGINHDIVGTALYPIDPKLGVLQNNGGVIYTHALLAGSPAIDAGDCTGLTIDQRGVTKPINGICDIGAFESDLNQTPATCPEGMIAYWKLDESSGLIYPNSFGSLNQASTTAQYAPLPVPGKIGGAQQFNGSTTRINVPANPSFDFTARSSFSVEFWYKGSVIPQTVQTAVGRYIRQTGARWFVGVNKMDGKAKFYVTEGGKSAAVTGSVLTDGNWHHVAATRNGITKLARIYVDGESKGQTNVDGIFINGFISATTDLNIGWLSFQNECSLNGILDEVAYYNTELSAAEIKQHYINGSSGQGYCSGIGVAPVITSNPDTTGLINQLYSFDINASGVPAPKYSLIRSPLGMTIDSLTGVIQWKPTSAGRFLVTVEAYNNTYPSSRISYTLNISDLVCSPGMISYWKLDETEPGNYTDYISGYSAVSSSAPVPVAGRVGGAQQFNGSSTKINVPANPSFNFGKNSNFIIEFWYKGTVIPSVVQTIIGRYIPETNSRWFIGINKGDGKIIFYVSNGGASASFLADPVVDGAWHYVALSRNARSNYLYIQVDNNRTEGTNISSFIGDRFTSLTAELNIGWLNHSPDGYLNGILDEVAISNPPLYGGDVENHYYNGLAGVGYCGTNGIRPVFTSTPVKNAAVGKLYSYDVNATGSPAPRYSFSYKPPEGMTIDQTTGLIQWIPSSEGIYSISLVTYNGVSYPVYQYFSISVTNLNTCPSSIISYWKLDETTPGKYSDYIGNNNAASNTPPTPVSGKVGGAQQFDGKTTKISVPANPAFDFGTRSSFSIEFWYAPVSYLFPTTNTNKSIVGRYIPATGSMWYVGLKNNDREVIFYMRSGGSSAAAIGGSIFSWTHIAATRNGTTGTMKIYVDGVLRDSTRQIFKTGFSSPTASLNIGWLSAASDFGLYGWLDEVAIYNTELSASDILDHYIKGETKEGYCSKTGLEKEMIQQESKIIPSEYKLFQNYPNPFNPVTKIIYELPVDCHVELTVYDILGNEIAVLVSEEQSAGNYNLEFNGSGLSSGIYFYKLRAGEFTSIKKLLLLK